MKFHALSAFQRDILYKLADCEDSRTYGLGLKELLEEEYEEPVQHSRLYPNLDELVEYDLIEKGQIDKRTNYYELSSAGGELLRRDTQRRLNAVEQLPGNDDGIRSSTTAAAGGDD